jgi:hypothetical protein
VWSFHDNEVVAQVASFELATVGTVVEVDHYGGVGASLESVTNLFLVLSSVVM